MHEHSRRRWEKNNDSTFSACVDRPCHFFLYLNFKPCNDKNSSYQGHQGGKYAMYRVPSCRIRQLTNISTAFDSHLLETKIKRWHIDSIDPLCAKSLSCKIARETRCFNCISRLNFQHVSKMCLEGAVHSEVQSWKTKLEKIMRSKRSKKESWGLSVHFFWVYKMRIALFQVCT